MPDNLALATKTS